LTRNQKIFDLRVIIGDNFISRISFYLLFNNQKMPNKLSSKRVIKTSLVVDISDILLNGIIALFTGSSVMLAEALQGMADLITVIFLYIGVKRSAKKSNRLYNFGYGRELYFWVLCSAIFMFVVTAGLSFYFGYQKFTNPTPLENTFWAYFVLFAGILTNLYALSVSARKINSSETRASLIKNFAKSHLVEVKTAFISDMMGTVSAIVGVIAIAIYSITGDPRYDGLGAMIIAIAIACFSIILIAEAKDMIIGRSAPRKESDHIREIVLAHPMVEKIVGLMTTYFGSEELYVNLNICIKQNLQTAQIEKLIDEIELSIKKLKPEVDIVQIEIDR